MVESVQWGKRGSCQSPVLAIPLPGILSATDGVTASEKYDALTGPVVRHCRVPTSRRRNQGSGLDPLRPLCATVASEMNLCYCEQEESAWAEFSVSHD